MVMNSGYNRNKSVFLLATALILSILSVQGLHVATTVTAQSGSCDVFEREDDLITLFDRQEFDEDTPLEKRSVEINSGRLQLAERDEDLGGGFANSVWNIDRDRVADGFISKFTVQVPNHASSDAGDGFAYVVQNDKIDDVNGGSGANLGAAGIAKAVVVKFDMCPDRDTSCDGDTKVSLERRDSDGNTVETVAPGGNCGTVQLLGSTTSVTVSYSGRVSNPEVTVNVGNCEASIDADLEDLFGSRKGWFGFTASTTFDDTADIFINEWNLKLQPSSLAVASASGGLLTKKNKGKDEEDKDPKVFIDDEISLRIILRDTCGDPVAFASGSDANKPEVTVRKEEEGVTDERDFIFADVNMEFDKDSDDFPNSWVATFDLEEIGSWELDIVYNGIRADGMPMSGAFISRRPPTGLGAIEDWQLALVILAILFVLFALSYVIYRLYRYRKKLKQNEEFINAGKKQAELDRLEDGTSYAMNPMMGTLDDLKDQLSKNEKELEKLRSRGEGGVDQEYTVEQLQKQRDGLLEEMNRLKQEQQRDEVAGMQGPRAAAKPNRRKQFGQQAAE